MDGVSKILHNAPRKMVGTGYVIIPKLQPRTKYIKACFKNQTVHIITNDGEIIPNCVVSNHVWNYLTFPQNINERGSCVLWVNVPYIDKVVITGVLNKKDELLEFDSEHTFKLKRKFGDGNIQITGNGEFGSLSIITNGKEDTESNVLINLNNENLQAALVLYVQGNIDCDAEKNIDFRAGQEFTVVVRDEANPQKSATIRYKLGEGFVLHDEFDNKVTTKANGVFIEVPPQVKVYNVASGQTGQPALLGDEVEKLLEENNKLLKTLVQTIETASKAGSNMPTAPFKTVVPALKLGITNLQKQIKAIKAKNINIT